MLTTLTPTNTPAPAVAVAPAAVVQPSAVAETPVVDTTASPIPVSDPLSNDNIQKRIDDFLAARKAAPAVAAVPAAAVAAAIPTSDAAVVADPAAPVAAIDPATVAPADGTVAAVADPAVVADAATVAVVAEPSADLVVELPSRNVGGVPLKIAAPDAATADALRRLNNGYMRGEDARARAADADATLAQARQIELMVQADPLTLIGRLAVDQRMNITRSLLAENFEALRPVIQAWWEDESEVRLARAEGLEARETARRTYTEQNTVAQQVRDVVAAVHALIPDTANADDASEFFQDATRHLAGIAQSRESGNVSVAEVPQLLARRLGRFGFTTAPNVAIATDPAIPAPAPAPALAAQPAPAAANGVVNVTRVHAINAQRAAAAATTTVGAGATPVTAMPKPPKGLTIEQAADWAIAQRRAATA